MMKKGLLLNLFGFAMIGGLFAQTQVGRTTYDLQTNNANCRRVATNANGEVVISYTRSYTNSEAAPDRGTGYNYKNSSGVWSETNFSGSTFTRFDVDRTGWPNVGLLSNGKEMIVSHFASGTTNFGGLQVLQRNLGSGTWSATSLNSNNPAFAYTDDATWPRMAVSGDSIIVISSTQIGTFVNGVDGGIFMHRSLDGGATWTEGYVPFVNGNNFTAIGADVYAIDANANGVVAMVVGRYNAFVLKSTDFGATWTTTQMVQTKDINGNDNPNNYSGASGESCERMDISDESYSLIVDDNGDVHVWFGRLDYAKEDAFTDGSVYPFSEGLMYWNETMSEPKILHSTRFTAEAGAMCQPAYTAAVVNDPDFIQYGLYYCGLVSQPSGAYDDNGNLVVAYSRMRTGIVDANDNVLNATADGYFYRDVFLLKSSDNGATWEGPFNVSNQDTLECVYPGIPRKIYNNIVPVIWQQDDRPGDALQQPAGFTHNYGENKIMYSEVSLASIVDPADVTCPTLALIDPANNALTISAGCDPSTEDLTAFLILDDVPQGPDASMVRVVGTPPNTTVPGTYNVSIYLEDNAGNTSDTVDIVLTVTSDNVAPTYEFVGPDTLQVVVGNNYDDPGLTYDDNGCFPSAAPDTTDNVNPALIAGFYTYTYTIYDNSGNQTTAIRYVEVIASDATPPAVTLNGMATDTVEACTYYDEQNATAFDLVDFTVPVTVNNSSVNINVVGMYTVTYTATDNSGNIGTATRTVYVVDNTPPTLSIIDDNDLVTPANSYTEGGVNYTYNGTAFVSPATSASDPNCNGSNPTISYDDANVNVNANGNYTVTYTATDENGNSTTQDLTVRVGVEPTPDFTYIATSTGLILTNTSTNNPTSYLWDFGNGQTSTSAAAPFNGYSPNDPTYPTYNVCLTAKNRFNDAPFNKTAQTTCKSISLTTGIADNNVLDAAVSIVPNPTNGFVSITISDVSAKDLTVSVTNVLGEQVSSKELSNINKNTSVDFDLTGQSAGIYFVTIASENASVTKRVVKQ